MTLPTSAASAPPSAQPDPAAPGLEGVYFDGRSSRARAARLYVAGQQVTLQVGGETPLEERWPLGQLHIDPPLARVRRVIKFPNGGRFETTDDAGVSALEGVTGRNAVLGRVRRVEASWGLSLGTLAVLGAFVWGFLTFGLPALARSAAAATPERVLAAFDRETLKVLQGSHLIGPSRLSAARQAELQREFAGVRAWAGGGYPYRLLLRDGDPAGGDGDLTIGANAFALPDGTVVMTDQLVALAHNDRELMGVLAHETGHVTHRHALASVYQGLGLSLLGTAITGDIVSAGAFAAGVPTALLSRGYSRRAETQADEVAGAYLLAHGGTTRPLRDILARLEAQDRDEGSGGGTHDSGSGTDRAERRLDDLLRTHPGTAQRLEHLRQIERAARTPGK